MVQLELPHVNVLSKMDLIEMYGKLGITKKKAIEPLYIFIIPDFRK